MTKTSTLAQSLATAAGKAAPETTAAPPAPQTAKPKERETVLIGANFAPEVRRVLKHLEAETGMNLKQLLGRAINRLAAENGKPEPYREE